MLADDKYLRANKCHFSFVKAGEKSSFIDRQRKLAAYSLDLSNYFPRDIFSDEETGKIHCNKICSIGLPLNMLSYSIISNFTETGSRTRIRQRTLVSSMYFLLHEHETLYTPHDCNGYESFADGKFEIVFWRLQREFLH